MSLSLFILISKTVRSERDGFGKQAPICCRVVCAVMLPYIQRKATQRGPPTIHPPSSLLENRNCGQRPRSVYRGVRIMCVCVNVWVASCRDEEDLLSYYVSACVCVRMCVCVCDESVRYLFALRIYNSRQWANKDPHTANNQTRANRGCFNIILLLTYRWDFFC